jgi:AcrR family transcriptional regulator
MKTTPRKPTRERREEIARAVLRIIGVRGLRSLTTATLAAEVGLTNGALYRHFDSLDDILIETVRYGVEKIDATFPDAGFPPLERLCELADKRIRLLRGDPGLAWLLRSEQAYLVLPAQAAARLRDAARRSRTFLFDAIVEGVAAGSVRDDVEPEALLVTVLGTIHALIGSGDPHPPHPERKVPEPDRVLSGLVRLLLPPGVPGPQTDTTHRGPRKETEP